MTVADFNTLHRRMADVGPEWIREFRGKSHTRFATQGLPHHRMEAWRNTSIEPIAKARFEPAAAIPELKGGGNGVWVGRLDEAPDTVLGMVRDRIGVLAGEQDHPFTALNGSLLQALTVVFLPENGSPGEPVQIIHKAGKGASLNVPRTLVLAGAGSSGSIIESYENDRNKAAYLTSAVTEIFTGEGSDLRYYRVQRENPAAFHIGRVEARVERGGALHTTGITLGAGLERVDAGVSLAGENAFCEMDSLFLTDGMRHADNRTRIEHAEPNCKSRQLYKGILADRSTAVFMGRIVVKPGAQQTDADQSNPNLLLSENATIHTRPQLEIYADDVRCTHGATVGQLDPESLFYLRSRGIDRDEAGRLLVKGFAGEILDKIDVEAIRTQIETEVAGRLPAV